MENRILKKILTELKKMKASIDVTYTKTYIPWKENEGFSVECKRINCVDFYDGDGNPVEDGHENTYDFEVYYLKNEKYIDVCSISDFVDEEDINSLEEFVRMYE